MRTRSVSNSKSPIACTVTVQDFEGEATAYPISGLVGNHFKKVMTDTVTPGFKEKRGHGGIFCSDMKSESLLYDCPAGPFSGLNVIDDLETKLVVHKYKWACDKPLSVDYYSGQYFSPIWWMTDADKTAMLEALGDPLEGSESLTLTNAYAKCVESPALLLVSVAEAEKSIETAGKAITFFEKRLAPFIRKWAKLTAKDTRIRTVRDAKRIATKASLALASEWLELRYGIMPLVYDFQSYAKVYSERGKVRRCRFVSTVTGSITPVTTRGQADYPERLDRWETVRNRADSVSSGVLIESRPELLRDFDSLGVGRLASTAWELIPYSFVLDWFANTADVIAAHEGKFSRTVLASWTTRRTTVCSTYQLTSLNNVTIDGFTRYTGTWQRSYTGFDQYDRVVRVANPSLDVLPSFKLRLNWKKFVDLAALARSLCNTRR